eukprot:27523-Pelagomonas_calceolata.AAC.1
MPTTANRQRKHATGKNTDATLCHVCVQVTLAQRDMPSNKQRKFQRHVSMPAEGPPIIAPQLNEPSDALLHSPSPSGRWQVTGAKGLQSERQTANFSFRPRGCSLLFKHLSGWRSLMPGVGLL